MRLIAPCVVIALLLGGCSGASSPATAPLNPEATSAGDTAALSDGEQLIGLWRLSLDPGSLQATIEAQPQRAAMVGTQARMYDLDISKFVSNAALRVTSVELDADTGDIRLHIAHSHPFPAPDFTAGINAKNRADLGYTGKLLVLADAQHVDFAVDNLTVDPTLIKLPDGYAATGDLLFKAGVTNNLFPYVLLVDEAKDNRVGVSNGGDPIGSYDAAAGGWQRSNAGANNTGWTGYDYIHGGQSVTTELVISKAKLAGGPVAVDLAILAKYSDPRGIPGPEKRFPAEPVNVIDFAYRLPQAAMDVSKCTSCGELQLLANNGATTTIQVTVRDWDGTATEAGDDDLSDETDVAQVLPGTTGNPTVTAYCPEISPTPLNLTHISGTGLPGAEHIYEAEITNTIGAVPAGSYYALVTITDPEDSAPAQDAVHFGVDPKTLVADGARALPVRSYELVPIRVTGYNGWGQEVELAGVSAADSVSVDANGRAAIVMSLTDNPIDADPGPCEDIRPSFGSTDLGIAWFDAEGNYEQLIRIGGTLYDIPRSATFDAAGGLLIGGRFISNNMDFDPGPGTAIPTNGTNFATGFLVRYKPDGTFDRVITYGVGDGGQAEAWAIDTASDGSIYLVGDVFGVANPVDMDPTAGVDLVSTDNNDPFCMKLNANGTYGWTRTISGTGPEHQFDSGRTVLATANNEVIWAGATEKNPDLDPGPGTDVWPTGGLFSDAFWSRLNADGDYVWGRAVGSSRGDIVWGLGEQSNGNIIVAGMWAGTIDFDTGAGNDIHNEVDLNVDVFVSRYTGDGTWVRTVTWGSGPGTDRAWSADVSADNGIFIGGDFTGTNDFEYGAGTAMKTALGIADPYVVRLAPNLDFEWVQAVEGLGTGQGRKVRAMPGNGAVLAMSYGGETDVHPGTTTEPLTGSGTALVRYPSTGDW